MPLTVSDCPKMCCSVIIPTSEISRRDVVSFEQVLFSLAILPVGVFAEKGCSVHLLVNIILTLLGYFPGLIHACIIIAYY
uniref:UPF0057-domain-containing protein n=1 Tax=Syphacia muris TaxID=451379 RepID=A0A0N5ANB0_9BILA